MSYRWVAGDGSPVDQVFDEQGQAEEWLTAFFDDLSEQGITEVSLFEEDRLVYGPMSLLGG